MNSFKFMLQSSVSLMITHTQWRSLYKIQAFQIFLLSLPPISNFQKALDKVIKEHTIINKFQT